MKQVRSHILLLILFLVYSDGFAQWTKIADFGELITTIYFQEYDVTPTIGFVGLDAPRLATKLWRTTDGGKTFTAITYPLDVSGRYTIPHHFTFKDNGRGWFSGVDGNSVFETTDGGITWQIVFTGAVSGIAYVPTTNLLLCSNVGASYTSSIDGINFNSISRTDLPATRSITFSDDLHGIITATDTNRGMLVTSDGGNNWVFSDLHSEFYQPLGIRGTQRFYLMSEASRSNQNNILFRSNDGGLSWTQLFAYKQPNDFLTTGTIQYGIDENIFFQTTELGNDGIMMSVDSGISFSSICGPSTRGDTKFFVRDSFIYAGDRFGGLWLNTTGIGSNSSPQLSKGNISIVSQFCNVKEDTLVFTLFDSCSGRQAELLEANITGSSRFSLAGGAIPRAMIENDTLRIVYTPDPNSALAESATIRMKFKLGWKVFDTLISVTGRNITPHLDITLTPVLTANNLETGKEAECNIYSSNRVQDRGLDKVSFDLTYDNDLLELLSLTTQNGMSVAYSAPIVTSGIVRLQLVLTGNNMTIESLLPIVSVKFKTFLTDTTLSTIELSAINLNNDNPDYKNCTLSATGNSTVFSQSSVCGDSSIRSFMKTGTLINILSINPNPTKSDITVTFDLAESGKVIAEVLDVLGNVVMEETLEARQGTTKHSITMSGAAEGVYYVRLRFAGETRTGKFIVE